MSGGPRGRVALASRAKSSRAASDALQAPWLPRNARAYADGGSVAAWSRSTSQTPRTWGKRLPRGSEAPRQVAVREEPLVRFRRAAAPERGGHEGEEEAVELGVLREGVEEPAAERGPEPLRRRVDGRRAAFPEARPRDLQQPQAQEREGRAGLAARVLDGELDGVGLVDVERRGARGVQRARRQEPRVERAPRRCGPR